MTNRFESRCPICFASSMTSAGWVMALVVAGKLNKQVGGELGVSEITVKVHRASRMRKMRACSLADLVNMAARLRDTDTKG
jgi:FixJ family two-component response regulator